MKTAFADFANAVFVFRDIDKHILLSFVIE